MTSTEQPFSRRVRLFVAYDGGPFSGFAINVGVRTIAGDLSAALERVLGHPVTLSVAGRTDKGVHASVQVCSFDVPVEFPLHRLNPARLAKSLNALCGPSISVREVSLVGSDFDARFSATWRRYHYTVWNDRAPNPHLAAYSWHVPDPLLLAAMNQAALPLLGQHDFSSFCRRPPATAGRPPYSLVRNVRSAEWTDLGDGRLRFEIEASAFCHQMVRSITALLVDVGRGRRRAVEVTGVLAAKDRARSTVVAPPHGLCLVGVGYPTDVSLRLPARRPS